ncbi:MAG: DUF2254 domain-containing protein [Bacteroidota bacterium]|nr:DUF2254 domain-containing protein [Bacteroidota bacterium]
MWKNIRIWIGNRYQRIINSIAFYPALIAIFFLILSFLFTAFDFSEAGKNFKSHLHWLSLKDATTARSIISSIVSGIISLAVFSFSMVMIILNQTASQMSNRILDKLIGNRFQQIILGIYIGTIVFALYLLSTIRDVDSGIYIPALSTYFLIFLTIADIFLFIYFLHFITQSVKYEVIIQRIYRDTCASMKAACMLKHGLKKEIAMPGSKIINANRSGVYEGFNRRELVEICTDNECAIHILQPPGKFVLMDTPILEASKELNESVVNDLMNVLYLHDDETIENNFFYGFRQLTEVAVKALSPGINDPATAIECLRALSKLFLFRMSNSPDTAIKNKQGQIWITTTQLSFEEIFSSCILPIWDYGKNDRMIQNELLAMLSYFHSVTEIFLVNKLLQEVKLAVEKNKY